MSTPPRLLCTVDIEVDGPDPGANSMLSLGCVASLMTGARMGEEIASFQRNLAPLPGAAPNPQTMRFWASQTEAWAAITAAPRPPETVMADFVAWLDILPGERVLAAHPLIFDGMWLDWYLRRFCNQRALAGPFPVRSPFVGGGVDIPSFVQGALGQPYFTTRPDYPAAWLGHQPHTHLPLDDARGHAALYFHAARAMAG